jgi:hypothetical protein
MGVGVVNVNVVGMVKAASQQCHSDVRCDCHEAHQCHLVKKKKMDVLEDCVGMGVAT